MTRANNLGVVAAQSTATRGNLDENIAGHIRLIRVAASFGADLIVFPELSLTGYELDLAGELQLTPEHPKLEPLRAEVEHLGVHALVGAPWRSGSDKPWLGAFLISPERSIGYAKIHVHESEDAFFAAGKEGCVVSIRGVGVGVAICADTNFPSHSDDAAANGADIYVASVMKTEEKYPGHAEKLKGYALRHGMAVLTANYAGSTGSKTSAGKSAIWDERGQLVARADATGEALVFARRKHGKWRGAVYSGPEFPQAGSSRPGLP